MSSTLDSAVIKKLGVLGAVPKETFGAAAKHAALCWGKPVDEAAEAAASAKTSNAGQFKECVAALCTIFALVTQNGTGEDGVRAALEECAIGDDRIKYCCSQYEKHASINVHRALNTTAVSFPARRKCRLENRLSRPL